MAHFAKLDENNQVIHISRVDDVNVQDHEGIEREEIGIAYLQGVHGADTRWVQTSYNHSFRGQYAMIGGSYDPINDVFLLPGQQTQ